MFALESWSSCEVFIGGMDGWIDRPMDATWRYIEKWSHSVMSDSLWTHGLYSPWNSPGQNTGVGSHSLLQGIFPTHGSNPGLPYCRWVLYQLRHQGSPRVGSLSLLQGIFPTQESNRGFLHCRWILYQLSQQGSPRGIDKKMISRLQSDRSRRREKEAKTCCTCLFKLVFFPPHGLYFHSCSGMCVW